MAITVGERGGVRIHDPYLHIVSVTVGDNINRSKCGTATGRISERRKVDLRNVLRSNLGTKLTGRKRDKVGRITEQFEFRSRSNRGTSPGRYVGHYEKHHSI